MVKSIWHHMRRTPPEHGDLHIGQLVLGPKGEITTIGALWAGVAKLDYYQGEFDVEDLIPIMKLTKGQWDALQAHTAQFSKVGIRRHMAMEGRRCKCHGLFYLGYRVERERTHDGGFKFRYYKDDLYALYNLSGVKNILYLEGVR